MSRYMGMEMHDTLVSVSHTSHDQALWTSGIAVSEIMNVEKFPAPSTLEELEQVLGSMVLKTLWSQIPLSVLLKESWTVSFFGRWDIPQSDSRVLSLGNPIGADSLKTSAES